MKAIIFLALAFLWGGSFIAIKIVVATVPPVWAAAFRLVAAVFLLFVIFKVTKKNLRIDPSLRFRVFCSALVTQGLPFALLFWGEQSISAGLAGILNGTVPLWTFIFGLMFMRHHEPFTLRKLTGLILGIIGLLFIFGPKLAAGLGNSSTLGAIAVGLMGISYGIGNIFNRSIMIHEKKPSLEGSLFWQSCVSMFFVTFLALLMEGAPHVEWFSKPNFIIATLYMGWMSTAIAFILYYRLINEWGAVSASSVGYLIPLSSVFLDFLINKNVPSPFDAIGTLVILAGIFILQSRVKWPLAFRRV